MSSLPEKIRYARGFRDDVVTFARPAEADIVVTNLPIDDVPAELLSLCENIAEKALLAYVVKTGGSVQYAHLDYCVAEMRDLANEFAVEFMKPLHEPGVTQIIPLADLAEWYSWHGLYGWGRAIRNPPGTEYA